MIEIKSTSSFMGLDSWVFANIIQLATFNFCRRFLNRQNDPAGRMFDQMTQAARSIQANISEGSARHQTSVETEMKLLDVARASASELAGDYMFILMLRGEASWTQDRAEWQKMYRVNLDSPAYGRDFMHDAMQHILNQYKKFADMIDNDDVSTAANAILILCTRVISLIKGQMKRRLEEFKQEGGFAENMTKTRLAKLAEEKDTPRCPVCGAGMSKRIIKRGQRSGQAFWGCVNYPRCRGTREVR